MRYIILFLFSLFLFFATKRYIKEVEEKVLKSFAQIERNSLCITSLQKEKEEKRSDEARIWRYKKVWLNLVVNKHANHKTYHVYKWKKKIHEYANPYQLKNYSNGFLTWYSSDKK